MQKVLVSATLSLQADKLHDWNLRSPCLYRATPKNVVQKNVTTEDEATSSMTSKNLPTSDVGRLTLPTGLTHEIVIFFKLLKFKVTSLITQFLEDLPTTAQTAFYLCLFGEESAMAKSHDFREFNVSLFLHVFIRITHCFISVIRVAD